MVSGGLVDGDKTKERHQIYLGVSLMKSNLMCDRVMMTQSDLERSRRGLMTQGDLEESSLIHLVCPPCGGHSK